MWLRCRPAHTINLSRTVFWQCAYWCKNYYCSNFYFMYIVYILIINLTLTGMSLSQHRPAHTINLSRTVFWQCAYWCKNYYCSNFYFMYIVYILIINLTLTGMSLSQPSRPTSSANTPEHQLFYFDRGSAKSGAKLVVYGVDILKSHLATLIECHWINYWQCTSSGRQKRMYHES